MALSLNLLTQRRRAPLRSLLFPIVLLLAFATMLVTNKTYFHALYSGPQQATSETLDPGTPNALLALDAPHAYRTGVHQVMRNLLHPSGHAESEYYEVVIGSRVLVVRVAGANRPPILAGQHFEGRLQPLASTQGLEHALHQALADSPNLPPVLPLYLDTTDTFRLAILTGALGLCALLSLVWRLRQLR